MKSIYHTKTNNFILAKLFNDFENLSKGQLVGRGGEKEVLSPGDGIIMFARNRSKIGDEAFLWGQKKDTH